MAWVRREHWIAIGIVVAGLSIAAAIGFDDAHLSEYQLKFASLLATVGGGIAVIFSALRYVWERQEELAWQKTSFMVELFKEFETDLNLCRAQQLIDYAWSSQDETRLLSALRPLAELDTEESEKDRRALDRYMDFFDHLYTYLFITKTLSPEDAMSFSGYAIDILDSKPLSDFALDWGYEDVLKMAIHFRDRAERTKREEETDRLKSQVELKRRER